MFMYSYCYVRSVLCILFHCVVLCTVLLPPGVNPTAGNKYIVSYYIIYAHIPKYSVMSTNAKNVTDYLNPLTPNDHYSGRTAPLTSKRWILYIYSTNTGTEYFKHGIHSPFLSLQNAVCFIILTHLVPVWFTFYIQGVLKFQKTIPVPNG